MEFTEEASLELHCHKEMIDIKKLREETEKQKFNIKIERVVTKVQNRRVEISE